MPSAIDRDVEEEELWNFFLDNIDNYRLSSDQLSPPVSIPEVARVDDLGILNLK